MSYNLLLETPNPILNVFALNEELNNLNLKSATVLLLKHSVSVINSETGLVYRDYDTAKGLRLDNMDIVYVKDLKCFVVALSDSSLLLIPEAAKKSSEFTTKKWPFQPLHLFCSNGRDVTVCGKDGQSCQFSLASETALPSVATTKSHTLSSTNKYITSCSSKNYYTVISEPTKAKKGDDSNSITLSTYKSRSTLAGKSVWLDADSEVTTSTLVLKSNEKVFKVLAHHQGGSLSVIVRNLTASSSRWIKVGVDGVVLFERNLTETPVAATEVADQLWLTYSLSSGSSKVSQWDVRFGVEVREVSVSTPHAGTSYVLPYGYCYSPTSTAENVGGVTTCHLLVASPVEGGSATALFRHSIAADAQITRSTLCSAIGKLSAQASQSVVDIDSSKPFNVSIYDDSAPKEEGEASTGVEGGRVLAGLPGPMKRKLKTALHQYDAQMELERAEYTATEDPEARVEKRTRRFYLDIPEGVSRAFLMRLESAKVSDLVSSDWEMVKVLVRSGTLSLASNPSLLSQASAAQRLDVLAHIVRHVPDLSEKQCVKILHLALFSSTAAVNRVSVSGGIVEWGAAAATSEPEVKSKGSKKSKASKTVTESESAPVDGDNRVLVLRALVEAVIQRTAAFSAVLLSEAIRFLSPSTCAILLRVFAYTVRGLSSAVNDSDLVDVQLGRFGDEQLRRAVTWMEALLDAHFSATALQASVHAPTRRALTCAMKVVSDSERAAEEVEAAMGLWTHISRVMHHGSEQTRPIPGLYQVERLTV